MRKGTNLFTTFSWMQRRGLELLIATFAIFGATGSACLAEVGSIRLGAHFYDAPGQPYQSLQYMSEILERLKSDMQKFVTGFDDCNDIVAGPLKRGTPRDSLRETWTAVHSIRVKCWAALQVSPATKVTPAGMEDRLTPKIIHGIMAHTKRISAQNSEWAKALIDFPGGEITCKDAWRCRLDMPDGQSPPEQSIFVDLIFATGSDRFIVVFPMVYGRASFAYGVRWRETESGGEVVDMFLGLE